MLRVIFPLVIREGQIPPYAIQVPDINPGNPWQADNTRTETFYLEDDGALHHWTSSVARTARKLFDDIFNGHLIRIRAVLPLWAAKERADLMRAARERGLKFSHRVRRNMTAHTVKNLAHVILRRAQMWAEFTVPDIYQEQPA